MKTDTSWFEGLKWAESQYHQFSPSVAEHSIRQHTYGRDDSFDQGARDYIRHYEQNLIHRPQPHRQFAA